MRHNPITKPQIARFWTICRRLGYDRPKSYLVLREVTGSSSLSAITQDQAAMLFERLEGEQAKEDKRLGIKSLDPRRRTAKQDAYALRLEELIAERRGRPAPGLIDGVSRRTFKKSWNTLSRRQASTVIEALKSILERGE